MATPVIRWGILGPGKIAHKFAADLQHVPGAVVHAVASRSKERAEAFAARCGAARAFGSYEALALCDEVDVVYVATPHTMHAAHVLMCVEAGRHVLCEKPFALSAEVAEAVFAAARRQGCFVMDALWTQFLPAFRQMMEWVSEGAIGELVSVQADFGFRASPQSARLWQAELGGGALWDIGIYPAFLAFRLMGPPPRWQALAARTEAGVDRETGIVARWSDGAMAHLHCSIVTETACTAWIHGTEGRIVLEPRWHESRAVRLERIGEPPLRKSFDYPGRGYQFEAMHVHECLDAGLKESPELPAHFTIGLVDWLEQVHCAE